MYNTITCFDIAEISALQKPLYFSDINSARWLSYTYEGYSRSVDLCCIFTVDRRKHRK